LADVTEAQQPQRLVPKAARRIVAPLSVGHRPFVPAAVRHETVIVDDATVPAEQQRHGVVGIMGVAVLTVFAALSMVLVGVMPYTHK